jgi:hypothetical protein
MPIFQQHVKSFNKKGMTIPSTLLYQYILQEDNFISTNNNIAPWGKL